MRGKEGMYIYIHIAESLYCTAETNTALESNYTLIIIIIIKSSKRKEKRKKKNKRWCYFQIISRPGLI